MDALSDDGRLGVTVIAFLGSVFSPWYALARRGTRALDPLEHSCFHVALYRAGSGGARVPRRWTMTERGAAAVQRDRHALRIGRSAMRWDGGMLRITLDEVTAPLPTRVRGEIRVRPRALCDHEAVLDTASDHRWTPIAPSARVEVALDRPDLRWTGDGYWDGNSGAGAIEDAFRRWHWCRMPLGGGRTAIDYEAERRNGERTTLALLVRADGGVEQREPEQRRQLERTRWGIGRALRADNGARVVRTLVDAPFYARTAVRVGVMGEVSVGVHESLDCDRFRRPWVQAMLPFRVPRAPW
ncbi:MAG: carotenoid 1,2-hydratase [Gluconacetobacter diazotrophicus]|nr:carotenoid 1,2-hydratase [Gluconacetobacter diazotrophicus]